MAFRLVLLLGLVIALATPAAAQSDRASHPPTKAKRERPPKNDVGKPEAGKKEAKKATGAKKDSGSKKESILTTPMVFYLAKGEDGACGPGCSEWIAAEGSFDVGATQRLRTLLTRLGKRKLPIFFHSPGGLGNTAVAMGRLLREREMTASVSQTIPTDCAAPNDQACGVLKRSGQTLTAELRPMGICASACVYALIGAQVRDVPPGARLGVHSGRLVLIHSDGRTTKTAPDAELSPAQKARSREFDAQFRRYVVEMKIDNALSDLSATIPHEKVHFLSRDEIARFGIDQREFSETRWTAMEKSPKQLAVVKFVVEAKGVDRVQYRTSMITLECAGPQRTRMVYVRGLALDEVAAKPAIKLVIDGHSTPLLGSGSVTKMDAIDTGGSFSTWVAYQPLEVFEAAAGREAIEIVETEPAGATKGTATHTTALSTAGLSHAIAKLRPQCGAAT